VTIRAWRQAWAVLALASFATPGHGRESPSQITAALAASDPALAALLRAHPRMQNGWREDFWADALLRAPAYPGSAWRVHDLRRPQPPVVHPPPAACAATHKPPPGAEVLFDGKGLAAFDPAPMGAWTRRGGLLISSGRKSSHLTTLDRFGDVRVHLEFREPRPPAGDGQYRGNSGLILMDRYEIQILDSYDNPTYADGVLGALYGQSPPEVNAARPPGAWQCLDVDFTAPRFNAGLLASPARATVRVNGVTVQDNQAFLGPTGFARLSHYAPHAARLGFSLQDHESAGGVAFRDVWAVALNPAEPGPSP
jgi:hypothetical protein